MFDFSRLIIHFWFNCLVTEENGTVISSFTNINVFIEANDLIMPFDILELRLNDHFMYDILI